MALPSVENTILYQQEWVSKVQERLLEPTKWKDICKVEFSNTQTLNNPYYTYPTVATLTRGCAYTLNKVTQTNETLAITSGLTVGHFLDRSDAAQSQFTSIMNLASDLGDGMNLRIEQFVFADYANLTAFDNASIGGAAGSITVSTTNIDNIVRGLAREIREASGETLWQRHGGFVVWRPADLEKLEEFIQAQTGAPADRILVNGVYQGIRYFGFDHYSSNQLNTSNIVAGVKKQWHLGVLRATYGHTMIDDKDPGQVSGTSVVVRADVGIKAWNNSKAVLFNVKATV